MYVSPGTGSFGIVPSSIPQHLAAASAIPAPSTLLSPSLHTASKHPTRAAPSTALSASKSDQCGSTEVDISSAGNRAFPSNSMSSLASHAALNASLPRHRRHLVPPICAADSPTVEGKLEHRTILDAFAKWVAMNFAYSSQNARRAPTHASLRICTTQANRL